MGGLQVSPNYRPHKKQLLLHNAPVGFETLTIILYGGVRGGGKSAGILMDAVFFATTYPGAKCMILRENLSSLKQSFIDKLPTLLPEKVKDSHGKTHQIYEFKSKGDRYPERTMVFPNGSYITFQRVDGLKEAMNKQGWEVHYLGVDEVTKQEEDAIDYLLTTVRTVKIKNPYTGKDLKIPTKVVFGCNPGGIGHKWVKRRFIDPTVIKKHSVTNEPLQTKDYVTYTDDPTGSGPPLKTIVRFIPASWRDNPFLSRSYVATLSKQPEHRRKMDMDGNWDVVAGRMFEFDDESFLDGAIVAKILREETLYDIYISIDWGYKPSYYSALWHAVFQDGSVITFKEMYGQELIFEDFVKEIKRRNGDMYITGTLLPHDMFRGGDRYRDEDGRNMGETKSDVFAFHQLNPIGVESGKGTVEDRYDKIHSAERLEIEQDGKKVRRFRISNHLRNKEELGLIHEIEGAVYDEHNPGKIAKSCLDHALDSYGHMLVYYSSDIAPIDISDVPERDERPKLQRLLDQEEEELFGSDEGNPVIGIAEGYEI